MDFRTDVHIPPSETRISYRSKILFMGSCFTEYIGSKMLELQFPVVVNPFGVNYNPSSLARNLWTLMKGKKYGKEDLEHYENRWFSFDHHSRFSHEDAETCLNTINQGIVSAHEHLKEIRFLLLTWGTAWVYVNKKTANVVSNCHKLPAARFSRHLLPVSQVVDTHTKLFAALRKDLPDLQIILSISPVRHWKDGPQLNSVSKSTLILAAHRLVELFSYCHYFPAWEIAMDDLRDYRYYQEDLIHPNSQMIGYIWEKFTRAWFEEETLNLMQRIGKLVNARNHRPFNPSSQQHRDFCRRQLEEIDHLIEHHPYLNLSEIRDYFNASLHGKQR